MTHTTSLADPAPTRKSDVANTSTPPTIHGWAMLPHQITTDARLRAVDVRVVALLLFYCKSAAQCTPCDQSIADLAGCSVGSVQRALRRLEACGYIRRLAVPPTAQNNTGRVIVLVFRSGAGEQPPERRRATPSVTGARPPRSPARDNEEATEKSRTRNVTGLHSTPIQTSQHAMPVLAVAPAAVDAPALPPAMPPPPAPRPTGEPTTPVTPMPASTATSTAPGVPTPIPAPIPAEPLLDALKAIPGATPDRVRATACRLAAWLDDQGSLGFYIATLARVAASGDPDSLARLLAAFAAGSRAKGSARRAGAVFAWAYANWVRPPRPSEIRYAPQQRSVPATQQGPPPLDREAELRELRIMAGDDRHPFQAVARARLAELTGEQGS